MTALAETDLTTSQKTQLAAAAVAQQGKYGVVVNLARQYELSRPTVYSARNEAAAVLEEHFGERQDERVGHTIVVDAARLRRAVVGLRPSGCNSIRAIEALLPILYDVHKSYGSIEEDLKEAEERAREFNAKADLANVKAGALDEMFSQGTPVLAGVDLDSGYLFALSKRESRGADDWAEVLEVAKKQGLQLEIVVKDAALGIAAGVEKVYPGAEQRDDCFHAKYEMGKVRHRLEQKAYGGIASEEEARRALAEERKRGRDIRSAAQQLRRAEERCQQKMELHDAFERAARQAEEAMEFVDLQIGRRRTSQELESGVVKAADQMLALDDRHCRRVGRYLRNRAPGLALYMVELGEQLCRLDVTYGTDNVDLACVVLRLAFDLREHRRRWNWHREYRHLWGAFGQLQHSAGLNMEALLAEVGNLLEHRHRASSAIEGFNAALRPHLYVHRIATQGFLELFRAYYNLRIRRWGRHKGTSAHECLTGERVTDWLTKLGYPPSTAATVAN
ncbi:MAG: hypothetical protein V2A73_10885 [Pseudomonadota bacterium]